MSDIAYNMIGQYRTVAGLGVVIFVLGLCGLKIALGQESIKVVRTEWSISRIFDGGWIISICSDSRSEATAVDSGLHHGVGSVTVITSDKSDRCWVCKGTQQQRLYMM